MGRTRTAGAGSQVGSGAGNVPGRCVIGTRGVAAGSTRMESAGVDLCGRAGDSNGDRAANKAASTRTSTDRHARHRPVAGDVQPPTGDSITTRNAQVERSRRMAYSVEVRQATGPLPPSRRRTTPLICTSDRQRSLAEFPRRRDGGGAAYVAGAGGGVSPYRVMSSGSHSG